MAWHSKTACKPLQGSSHCLPIPLKYHLLRPTTTISTDPTSFPDSPGSPGSQPHPHRRCRLPANNQRRVLSCRHTYHRCLIYAKDCQVQQKISPTIMLCFCLPELHKTQDPDHTAIARYDYRASIQQLKKINKFFSCFFLFFLARCRIVPSWGMFCRRWRQKKSAEAALHAQLGV